MILKPIRMKLTNIYGRNEYAQLSFDLKKSII